MVFREQRRLWYLMSTPVELYAAVMHAAQWSWPGLRRVAGDPPIARWATGRIEASTSRAGWHWHWQRWAEQDIENKGDCCSLGVYRPVISLMCSYSQQIGRCMVP
ncbi:hypothetical protein O3P69_015565 [Scylla paramamosain]|uniref:Uncharacterized protein n=1 Tax=Scylla paramamosain TaxID=85552 RepID=A0AAW0SH72_SCYPA